MRTARRVRTLARLAAATALLAVPGVMLANGGTVRISRQKAGPFLVSVYTEPTPLRTGAIDVSVLLQDTASEATVLDADVTVSAEPVAHDGVGGTFRATRAQATNKLFKAAEFAIQGAGLWRFTVTATSGAGTGTVTFEAAVRDPGLLDRPFLVVLLLALPLGLVAWLLTRSDAPREEEGSGASREG